MTYAEYKEICKRNENKIHVDGYKAMTREESDRARKEYWSEYWRKHNHIAKGCVTW